MNTRLTILWVAMVSLSACSQTQGQIDPYDSGGPLMPEQAAYDVTYYELALDVNPADSSISGSVQVRARVGSPMEYLVLDLVPDLRVERTTTSSGPETRIAPHERRGGKIWIQLPRTYQPGEEVVASIHYAGRPRIAVRPPWDGGFTWAATPSGEPWIATSCQGEGADIWWPVKDHVSDEPDSMTIRITVPEPLVVASNGRLRSVTALGDGRSVYDWFVSTPINTYTVALNIAPYRVIQEEYQSVTGEALPVQFYVLPEDYQKGLDFTPEILAHLRFYEERLGPYPFRADKYGVAQTPHLGMEHQSIIAYGANFSNLSMTPQVDFGFDKLHHHELSHEWWGNLVTNADWKDLWIHEGFGSYMQVLYAEELDGPEGYQRYLETIRPMIANQNAVAPRESMTVDQMGDRDVYFKGAWILHTLRHVIGADALNAALRRMAYPDPSLELVTDGRQCRFASTEDFIRIAEEVAGQELDWFFEAYVRQPKLPELQWSRKDGVLTLRWFIPGSRPFPMPVEVRTGTEVLWVEMDGSSATVEIADDVEIEIDPDRRILMRRPEGR